MYVTELIIRMHRSGFKVAAYCLPGTRIERELREVGIRVYEGHKNSHFSLADIREVRRIVKKDHWLIVHSHTRKDVWTASLALLFFPTRVHVNSVYMVVSRKLDLIHRLIYSRVDAIVSSSQHSNDKIAVDYPVSSQKIHLIRYARDFSKFHNDEESRRQVRTTLGYRDSDIVVGMIGRIDPGKGVREFAESLNLLSPLEKENVRYLIIGDPTISLETTRGKPEYELQSARLYEWLIQYSKRSDIQRWLTLLPFQSDIVPYLNALDILVLASYAEMYSLSVIEAMAMGLPVIGTNSEGTPEQVQDGVTGILVEPKSPQSIATAVAHYANDPPLMRQHGKQGRIFALQNHAAERTLERFRELYERTLRERS